MTEKDPIRLNAARDVELARDLSRFPQPREGEMLVWTDHPHVSAIQEAIYQVIGELPARVQEVILARYGEGLTLQETAERFPRIRTRERVRQLEARGLRRMRMKLINKLPADVIQQMETFFQLDGILAHEIVPGGPLDPRWISTQEASELTNLSIDHLRRLCAEGTVTARRNPAKRNENQILKESLKAYILGQPRFGRRRKGVWKEGSDTNREAL